MTILLKNAHLVDPGEGLDTVADLLVEEGIIRRIGPSLAAPGDARILDMAGRVAAPGFVDMHVHLREPGFEHKETIATGTLAAAAGGFTGVCCMPNTQPPTDDASVVRRIIERSRQVNSGIVDVYPIAAVTRGREGKELAPMMELAEAGAVAFSDDGSAVEGAEIMRRALEYAAMLGRPVIQHAEDHSLTKGGVMNEGIVATALGMQPIPDVAESTIVARDILLAEYTGAAYHVAHISTEGALELVRQARRRGIRVTCEAAPHHFSLTEEAVRSFDTNTKMNPPLRTARDVAALKEGFRDGSIDAVATDHAPHSFDEKEVEYMYAPFGIIGLETAVGLAVTELLVPGYLSLAGLIRVFAVNPRRIMGLPPASLRVGEQASLTLLDPAWEWVVDREAFSSKSKNTPFHGRKLTGKAFGILNHGMVYLLEGKGVS